MHKESLSFLVSPCCRASLVLKRIDEENVHFREEVYAGELGCGSCSAAFQIRNGVPILMVPRPDFSDRDEWIVKRNKEVFDIVWSLGEKLSADDYRRKDLFLEDISVDETIFSNAAVLEAGIGPGRALSYLLEAAPSAILGIDISDQIFRVYDAVAPRAGGTLLCLVQADLRHLPFRKGAFDFVLASRTLHHVPEPARRIEDLVEVLRPGGRLSMTLYAANRGGLFRLLRRAVEQTRILVQGRAVRDIYRWTLIPALAVYFLTHFLYPLLTRIPGVKRVVPLRTTARAWSRLRLSNLRVFVVLDDLLSEVTWFASESELSQLLARLPVSKYHYRFQNEGIWSAQVVK